MDIRNLRLEEKARLVCGHSSMSTYPIEREGIAAITLSDGPNGLRKEQPNGDSLGGISESLPATCFPAGVTLASTFNSDLAYQEGEAIAKECQYYHVNVILGPAMNIKRNPLCGRNFEYYSEDPLVSAKIAIGFVTGAQNQHVACCPKHFSCNNEENHRFTGNSVVEERSLREIYLRPYEAVVRNTHPWAMMNSYNQINGTHASENKYIMKDILRDEWGFDGVLMTDWGGIVNRVEGLKATTDLEMPGMVETNISAIVEAVKNKKLDEAILDTSVTRILKLQERTKAENTEVNFHQHHALAERIAEEGPAPV